MSAEAIVAVTEGWEDNFSGTQLSLKDPILSRYLLRIIQRRYKNIVRFRVMVPIAAIERPLDETDVTLRP